MIIDVVPCPPEHVQQYLEKKRKEKKNRRAIKSKKFRKKKNKIIKFKKCSGKSFAEHFFYSTKPPYLS